MPAQLCRAVLLLVIGVAAACGDGAPSSIPTAPSAPPTGQPDNLAIIAPISVSSVRIGGTLALAAIGATSQLSATATFTDGTTKDVTGEARWIFHDSDFVIVSSTGLLTAVGLGAGNIGVSYSGKTDAKWITVTPTGTFVAHGRVREPGRSGLPDVRVSEVRSGKTVTSRSDGSFFIPALMSGARLRFQKDGYEVADVDVPVSGSVPDVPLQQIIRLAAGETATPTPFAPDDLEYVLGSTRCLPCRRIRIVVSRSGVLEVTARATSGTILILPDGQKLTSDSTSVTGQMPVSGSGEVVIYFGMPEAALYDYISFTIETKLR